MDAALAIPHAVTDALSGGRLYAPSCSRGHADKLAMVEAVGSAVAAGCLAWDDVVSLEPRWRSLPSGILQDWPDGTPLTVAMPADLAISLSDNTATDALIHLVGRQAVEAITPRNAPFPTTREPFTLKARANGDLRRIWRESDTAGRRRLLKRIAKKALPSVDGLSSAVTTEVEAVPLGGGALRAVGSHRRHPDLAHQPGPAGRGGWRSVAYKSGSEQGVLNLSIRLVSPDGETHCVVATWNDDAPLDEDRLLAAYRAILEALRDRSD